MDIVVHELTIVRESKIDVWTNRTLDQETRHGQRLDLREELGDEDLRELLLGCGILSGGRHGECEE